MAEAAGNPLALLEFEAGLTADELSGAAPLTRSLRFGGRLEELYLSQVRALPADAQLLLLLAAAEQPGEPGKIWRAAEDLGIDPEVAGLPAVKRLVSWAPQIQFRHSLMRSAAYYAAGVTARRRVHAALAAASDPERDPDRRAWHRAQAAAGPTSGWRRSWSSRLTGRAPGTAGPAVPPSWNKRPGLPLTKGAGRSVCSERPKPGWRRTRCPPRGCWSGRQHRTWRLRSPGGTPGAWRA